MPRITNEYLIDGERYTVDVRVNVLLGVTKITVNEDKYVLRSLPFKVKRREPFKIGEKRCVLNISSSGKPSIE